MRPIENAERDKLIHTMLKTGTTSTTLEALTGLSRQRLHQIKQEQETKDLSPYQAELHLTYRVDTTVNIHAKNSDDARDKAQKLADNWTLDKIDTDWCAPAPDIAEVGSIYGP